MHARDIARTADPLMGLSQGVKLLALCGYPGRFTAKRAVTARNPRE
jgi:hypothetical protein